MKEGDPLRGVNDRQEHEANLSRYLLACGMLCELQNIFLKKRGRLTFKKKHSPKIESIKRIFCHLESFNLSSEIKVSGE